MSGDRHQFDGDVVWSFGRGGRSAVVLSHHWLLFLSGLHGAPAMLFFSWALATLPRQKICFTEKQLSVESKSISSAWIQEIFVIFSA